MKLKINKILTISPLMIEFTCSAGSGKGVWANNKIEAITNYSYTVEIDTKIILSLGKNCLKLKKQKYNIKIEDNITKVQGEIIDIEDDNMGYFRLSKDCIIMIEVEDNQFNKGDFIQINFNLTDFEIYVQ